MRKESLSDSLFSYRKLRFLYEKPSGGMRTLLHRNFVAKATQKRRKSLRSKLFILYISDFQAARMRQRLLRQRLMNPHRETLECVSYNHIR